MLKNIIIKYKSVILFIIGSILIIIALYLSLYSRIDLVRERVFSEIELLIENNGIVECNYESCDDNDSVEDTTLDVETDYIEEDEHVSNDNKPNNNIKKNYIGYLNIPKISLNYGFVEKKSYYNNVNRNITIIEPSDFPNVEGGNFILAGHSGTSSVSFFKKLYLLKLGDIAKITYDKKLYTYKIVDIYKDSKDGSVVIKRDKTKTTLTLITCSYKDKKNHTVYILELESIS